MTDVAGIRISNLPPLPMPLTGAELFPVDQNGTTYKATTAALGFGQTLYAFATTTILLSAFDSSVTLPNGTSALTAGRTVVGTGGAIFYYDSSDHTTADNGGTVRVDTNGRRWKAPANTVQAELFGVIPNSSGSATVNAAALNAALVACPEVVLQAADYYVASLITHNTPNGILRGNSSLYDSLFGNRATRLILTNGTGHVLLVGAPSDPGGIAQFTEGLKVLGIEVTRSVPPVATSGCDSILVQYALEAYFQDVRGDESMNGWEFNATVDCRAFNCSAKRSSAGTGGADSWKGFYANGNSGIAAGGNASLYWSYCHADDTRAVKTNGSGFYADVNYTDLFLDHIETVSCAVGVNLQGNSSTGANSGNTDVHIIHPILDQFSTYGILIQNMAQAGSVDITSCYMGPSAGATAALEVLNSPGAVNLSGGQLVMGAAPTCKAVKIESSSGVRLGGTMILECTETAIEIDNSTNCRIEPIIKNQGVIGGAGVQLNGTNTAHYIAPTIMGHASGTALGIQVVGTGDGRNEYNCSGIDSATIAGGSGNKLVRNGVQITTTGLSGTNLVSGVMT